MTNSNAQNTMLVLPNMLGMEKTIELIGARHETFFYRNMHKRLIDHLIVNDQRWRKINGPLVYAVTDSCGVIRYFGKWESATALFSRWVRHKTIHHQERARNFYLSELDDKRAPLSVWSISVSELKSKLPVSIQGLSEKNIAVGLEALWIKRWRNQLDWNHRDEPVPTGFDDGDFWSANVNSSGLNPI